MNPNEYDVQRDKFEDWCDQWDKAQSDGIFDNAPQPVTPTSQTADVSFFGPTNTNPTPLPKDVDSDYWRKVYSMSSNSGDAPDVLMEANKLPETEKVGDAIEDTAKKKQSQYPPNPVRIDSGGNDQNLAVEPLGLTFDEKDVQELADMKIRLHELGDKLASSIGKGSSIKRINSQIESLKKKVEELSTAMTHSYPTDIARLSTSVPGVK